MYLVGLIPPMYETILLKNEVIRNSLKLAEELERNAGKLESETKSQLLNPSLFYLQAYQIYQAIAGNLCYEKELRGEATYKMWKLSKKIASLDQETGSQASIKISGNKFLIQAANLGYKPAEQELEALTFDDSKERRTR